jgi:hypothetical protein
MIEIRYILTYAFTYCIVSMVMALRSGRNMQHPLLCNKEVENAYYLAKTTT